MLPAHYRHKRTCLHLSRSSCFPGLAMIEGSTITLQCEECRASFPYVVHSCGRYPRTCSPECHAVRRRNWNRANGHRYRTAEPRPKIHKGNCAICFASFEASNLRTRTCGPTCSKRLADSTKRAKSIARRMRNCELCGQSFVAHKPSGKAYRGKVREGRFCSRRCAHAAARKPRQLSMFDEAPRTSSERLRQVADCLGARSNKNG